MNIDNRRPQCCVSVDTFMSANATQSRRPTNDRPQANSHILGKFQT